MPLLRRLLPQQQKRTTRRNKHVQILTSWAMLCIFALVTLAAHKNIKVTHTLRRSLAVQDAQGYEHQDAQEYEHLASRQLQSFDVTEKPPPPKIPAAKVYDVPNPQNVQRQLQETDNVEVTNATTPVEATQEEATTADAGIPPKEEPAAAIKDAASAVLEEESKAEQEVSKILTKLQDDMCGDEWVNADPLPYDNCDPKGMVNAIPLHGGLTNALKMILLGAVGSWEEQRCFFVDESKSHLNPPDKHGNRRGFLHKYMETIGLPLNHPIVTDAFREKRVVARDWSEFWNELSKRRAHGQVSQLRRLGFGNIEGHNLKRTIIRRLWRPLPQFRQASCSSLENDHGLRAGDYIAFSVRRGDKTEEKFAFTELQEYIDEAHQHFHRFPKFVAHQEIPTIFVATDDCTVMKTFREMKPDWTFVSECDVEERNSKAAAQDGFALKDFAKWDHDAEAAHFTKFFTEIYAMTLSRVFIGVAYTNVSWWVYFLRPFRHSFVLLDRPKGQPSTFIFDNW